jgi:SAM-dependent methyltransferase
MATTHEGLRKRNVTLKVIDICEEPARFDEFITGPAHGERRWEVFELTQSHDVSEWIEQPDRIKGIRENLVHLWTEIHQVATRPLRLLDVGCYGGYVYDFLTRQGMGQAELEYRGMDIQPLAIDGARHAHRAAPNATFEVGDLFDLKHQCTRASYDVVVCSRVLIHLPFFETAVGNLLHATNRVLVIVLKIEEPPVCRRIEETDCDTKSRAIYYYRSFAQSDLQRVARELGTTVAIKPTSGAYSSVIFQPEPH